MIPNTRSVSEEIDKAGYKNKGGGNAGKCPSGRETGQQMKHSRQKIGKINKRGKHDDQGKRVA
jgi:hypothetical protein